jgi:hypothetical protein
MTGIGLLAGLTAVALVFGATVWLVRKSQQRGYRNKFDPDRSDLPPFNPP